VPRKVFVAGEILTAADVNTNLMDQAVMVFDDSAARGSAIPSPSEGMVTYLKDTDQLEKYTTDWVAAGGKILQVVQTVLTGPFSTASTTFTDLTGLSVSITPTLASSKILVTVTLGSYGQSTAATVFLNLVRGSTNIAQPSVGSSPSSFHGAFSGTNVNQSGGIVFLDSPNTTSATTYKVMMRVDGSTGFINRLSGVADFSTVSTITAYEVAA
jgi:hypothetical protein